MTLFVLLSTALAAGILLFVLLPVLRGRNRTGDVSTQRVNIGIYRDQLRELDDDLAAGTIDGARHAEARAELERRLLDDTAGAPAGDAGASRTGGRTAAVLAVIIPPAVIGLYLAVGTPQAVAPQPAGDPAQNITPAQVEALVEKLAARMKSAPDDPFGWIMLGRSYAALERFSEAAGAYAEALARKPGDAQLLVDYADVLAMAQGRQLTGEPAKLVQRALAIDPDNPKALALAGTIAFEQKKYADAVTHWQKLAKSLPAGSEIASDVQASIAEAQALAGTTGVKSAATKPAAEKSGSARKDTPVAARVSGSVHLADALKARAAPDDTVFIFARAVDGPPAPLAILRKRVADLPLSFTLDDSMAMTPGMNLSRFPKVIIGVRISRTGSANRQPGNLEGFSKPVAVGAKDIAIVIDAEVR